MTHPLLLCDETAIDEGPRGRRERRELAKQHAVSK